MNATTHGGVIAKARNTMLKLTDAELDAGLAAIQHHGYSDFFPKPPEFDVILDSWPHFKKHLADVDLDEYKAYRPSLELSAPKSVINLRRVTLLHPLDLIIFTSIVRVMRDDIEANRIEESEKRVFSFRTSASEPKALYKSRPSHAEFKLEVWGRARKNKKGWMVLADIADFYYRLYQHRVRNAVEAAATNPRNVRLAGILEKLLRRFGADNVSFGIPIGPAASRLLAEVAITDVDNALLSHSINFVRYIDDYVIFTDSKEAADWAVRQLGEILYSYHGLTLQTAKTKVIKCSDHVSQNDAFTDDETEVEKKFNDIVEDHFYEIDSIDELTPEQLETIDAVNFADVLEEALNEVPINYKKVTFILEKLSALENDQLIEIVLDNLELLYPVAHAVNSFFRGFEHLPAKQKKKIAESLLKPILPTQRYRAPEYYAVWILNLFANHAAWNHKNELLHIFRDTQSQTIKRYAALAIGNSGSRSEAVAFKEHIAAATPLTRTAILLASAKLPRDERTHWRKSLNLTDPLEKAIP